MQPNQIVPEVVIEAPTSAHLELISDARKYREQMGFVRELGKDLKDNIESHSLYAELTEAKARVKQLKAQMDADPDIDQTREELKTARERKQLLGEILITKMADQQLSLFESDGINFKINKSLKLKKATK